MQRTLIGLAAIAALAGCGNRSAGDSGPDEFSVQTARPLIYPATNALPVPTPGGTNPADPNPRAQAIAALNGAGG